MMKGGGGRVGWVKLGDDDVCGGKRGGGVKREGGGGRRGGYMGREGGG